MRLAKLHRCDARSSYKFVSRDVSVIQYSLNLPHSALRFFKIATKMLGKTSQLKCTYNVDESMLQFDVVDLKALCSLIIFQDT